MQTFTAGVELPILHRADKRRTTPQRNLSNICFTLLLIIVKIARFVNSFLHFISSILFFSYLPEPHRFTPNRIIITQQPRHKICIPVYRYTGIQKTICPALHPRPSIYPFRGIYPRWYIPLGGILDGCVFSYMYILFRDITI